MNRRAVLFFVVALVLLASGAAWLWTRRTSPDASASPSAASAVRYHCPMHPAMTSDRPADCPICHMRMVPMDRDEPTSAPEAPAEPDGSIAGHAAVRIQSHKMRLIGVKTSRVTRSHETRAVRAVGRVVYDETREKHVTTKTAGYVERLYANAVGETFEKGQPLLEIYSPELLATQQEYLLALRARARTAGSSVPTVADAGDDLVATARRRLELFDVPETQIRDLETTGRARRTVTLYAPEGGHLTHRAVFQGDRVEAGAHLLDLTDLSRVWVLASVYEYELPFVRVGQRAVVTLSYLPGRTFEGRVTLIQPILDPATRTVQVRVEIPNRDLALKPDMFAEVRLEADLGERLWVPDTAVMDTGVRSVVFVDRGEGLLEPREVAIGLKLPDRYEVLGGLAEGDSVVTSGNFFVDSESKLKAFLVAMTEDAPPEHTHGRGAP